MVILLIKIESGCVDCGLPCVYNTCPHYEYVVYECDCCGEESKLYHFDGQELCLGCIEARLEEVYYNE